MTTNCPHCGAYAGDTTGGMRLTCPMCDKPIPVVPDVRDYDDTLTHCYCGATNHFSSSYCWECNKPI